jgi:hypothetical protein
MVGPANQSAVFTVAASHERRAMIFGPMRLT